MSYIWGKDTTSIIDVLVLGNSLHEHNVRGSRFLCVNDDTLEMKIAKLAEAFWMFMPVSPIGLPKHLAGSEQHHLQGLCSKLQTLKLFDSDFCKKDRILMVEAALLVRSNIDDMFAVQTPAAVMKEEEDTSHVERRPDSRFSRRQWRKKSDESDNSNVGGIKGGVVLLKPDSEEYEQIIWGLQQLHSSTKKAEQEFLNWFYERYVEWYDLPKMYNFETNELFMPLPANIPGRRGPNSCYHLVTNPAGIKVLHFNTRNKPSCILRDEMVSVSGWLQLEVHLKHAAQSMRDEHASSNPEINDHPKWLEQNEEVHQDVHDEWFEAWKRTYVNVIAFVVHSAFNDIIREIRGGPLYYECSACQKVWLHDDVVSDPELIRDHILFNCRTMAAKVCIPVQHMTNLMAFLFVPCGRQVESKLLYLSEVYNFYKGFAHMPGRNETRLTFDFHKQPEILLPNYSIPESILAVTEKEGKDAAYTDTNEPEVTARAHMRRYQRAMETIRNSRVHGWVDDEGKAKTWWQTLYTADSSCRYLIEHVDELPPRRQATSCLAPSSSSGSQAASSSTTSMQSTLEPVTGLLLGGTPPWRMRPPPPSVSNRMHPPPPPPPTRLFPPPPPSPRQ